MRPGRTETHHHFDKDYSTVSRTENGEFPSVEERTTRSYDYFLFLVEGRVARSPSSIGGSDRESHRSRPGVTIRRGGIESERTLVFVGYGDRRTQEGALGPLHPRSLQEFLEGHVYRVNILPSGSDPTSSFTRVPPSKRGLRLLLTVLVDLYLSL